MYVPSVFTYFVIYLSLYVILSLYIYIDVCTHTHTRAYTPTATPTPPGLVLQLLRGLLQRLVEGIVAHKQQVQHLGSRVQGSGFGLWGLGFRAM